MSCSDSRIVALLAAFFNPSDWGVTSGEFEYVQRVVDEDTLVLGTGERVRLIGVDTPESVRPNTPVQRFGKEAADFTRRMAEGKRVRLEYDQANAANGHKDNTQQKRTLAYVGLRRDKPARSEPWWLLAPALQAGNPLDRWT
jgi:endonuclease YncB( thermonuclease family)